jgi:hypothetical protein
MRAAEVLLILFDAEFCVLAMNSAKIASDIEELDLGFNVSSRAGV